MFLHAIFDPEGRWADIQHMRAYSLLIDSKSYPLEDGRSRASLINGLVNIIVSLPSDYLEQIQNSRTVGFASQFTFEAPTFFGFRGMEFSTGRELFLGLRRSCR
jgi:hypothetical protein